MPKQLHGRATTTPTIRKQIQESKKTILELAKHYGINPKTVAKWKKRDHVHDLRPGPPSASKSLTRSQEAAVIAFRKHTLLSLDDCFYALRDSIPHLTRSCLYRCFKRHSINRLPSLDKEKKEKKKFKAYPPGYVHVDITQVRTKEGKLYLFVGIDRITKFCIVQLYDNQRATTAVIFIKKMVDSFPNRIHTILTDNGKQFTHHKQLKGKHVFAQTCLELRIAHRLTLPYHPWTNGQVERMNRTIKEATVKKYFYKDHKTLQNHLDSFFLAYNYARPLKVLNGVAPYEKLQVYLQSDEGKSLFNPMYKFPKLNS